MKAVAKLQALYARVPPIRCKPGCHDCCGPIPMTELEYSRLFATAPKERIGKFPVAINPCTGDCPLVSPITGRCSAYERRPLICRLFGVAPGMACPHVTPDQMLSDVQATEMIEESERIGNA